MRESTLVAATVAIVAAYAPTSNTANQCNHEKINSWVSFSFLYGYGAPVSGPSGRWSSAKSDTISSHVKISMISLVSSLPLELYLNSSVYHRNIFGSSSKVCGNLRTSSEILGKCSGTFVWPLKQFCKIFGNLRKIIKTQSSVCLYNKKNITR